MQPKVGDQPDDFGFKTSQRHLVPARNQFDFLTVCNHKPCNRSVLRHLVVNRDARRMTCHEQDTQIV